MMCQCEKRFSSNLFTIFAIVICTVGIITAESCTYPPDPSARCEAIDYEMCLSFSLNTAYNSTSFPNVYNHQNLAQSRNFLDNSGFLVIDSLNCSQYTKLLVCSAVYPLCTPGLFRRVDPCRELCTKVKNSCESDLIRLGYSWPMELDCDQFPQFRTELCIYHDKDAMCTGAPSIPTGTDSTSAVGEKINSTLVSPSATCLGRLSLINDTRANFADIEGCIEPCDGVFFEQNQNILLGVWTMAFSLLSMVVSVLICLTFIVSYKTITRLETPIYYIAFCYAVLGLVNTISIAIGKESITCDQSLQNSYNQSVLVTSGLTSPLCSILFSFTYYSTLCTWSWWVVLTLEWSISSISNSDIGNILRVILHFVAWGIPFVFLLAAVITGEFSGNVITQSCWVHKDHEIAFLLVPLAVSFLACSFIIVISFVRVTDLQNKMLKEINSIGIETPPHPLPSPGTIQPSLLFRVGTYATFYLLPMGALLCCYLYQYWFRKQWENAYLSCPFSSSLQVCETIPEEDKPLLPVLVTQITSSLSMGFVSVFWLLRHQSLLAWRNLCCVCFVWNAKQSYERTAQESPLSNNTAQTIPTTATTPTQQPSRESQV